MSYLEPPDHAPLDAFLDLVSDIKIRSAAWPLEEWLAAGGTMLGYGEVTSSDSPAPPPILRLRGLLDCPPTTEPGKPPDPALRAARLAEHWNTVTQHPIYAWLRTSDHFRKADAIFEHKRTLSKSGPLLSEFAHFRFLRIVASLGYFLLLQDRGIELHEATKREMTQAKRHVQKLVELFGRGVRLRAWESQFKLEKLLRDLESELGNAPRKDRDRPTIQQRKCLDGIALAFLTTFHETFPAIISELAEMAGWHSADRSTIERIARAARDKYRRDLAKTLLEYPQTTA